MPKIGDAHWPRSGSVQPAEVIRDHAADSPAAETPRADRWDQQIASGSVGSAPLRNGPQATLRFGGDWSEAVSGTLKAGGQLTIDFDPSRAQLRNTHNGSPAWGVTAYVKFHPGEAIVERPAVEFESIMGRPTNTAKPSQVVIDIPQGAVAVEVWFKNWSGADHPAERWDSDFSRNYRFPIDP